MKALIVTCVLLLFSFPTYTSRIEVSYDADNKGLLITMQGQERIEEVSIYSGKELLTSFKPSFDTVRIKRECPVAGKIRYVVKLRSGLVIDDRNNRKTDLKHVGSYIEICEPRD